YPRALPDLHSFPTRRSSDLRRLATVFTCRAGRKARDYDGQLPEHLRPTVLGALERLFAERQGDIEARMLEKETRPLTVRLKLETDRKSTRLNSSHDQIPYAL